MRVCPECFGLYGTDQEECAKDATRLVHHSDVLIGRNLGPYIVRSLLTEGGMGIVYVAEHPALGRRVAIKVLRPEWSLRDDIVERFVLEARAVNTIGHANIVSVYDFGKTPFGSFYIVMEYLNGRSVRELLDQGGPQPLERIRWVLHETGSALASAHAKGFVHRDVKPANIVVCRQSGVDMVKLVDFGIAKLLTEAGDTSGTGDAMGTPQYMSPEALDDRTVDHRTDIFALGVVGYEMLTGQVPYAGTSQAAVRHAQTTCRPALPSACRRDVRIAPSFDRVLLRALALDPNERFGSMQDMLQSLATAYEDTLAWQSRPTETTRRVSHQRWWIKVYAMIGLFGLAAGGFWVLWRNALLPGPAQLSAVSVERTSADDGSAAAPPASSSAISQLAEQTLETALSSVDRDRRRLAVQLLREAHSEPLRGQLIRALNDRDSLVRRTAALALGEMRRRDPATIKALRAALPVQMSFAAIAVAKALAQLGDAAGLPRLYRELVLARRRGPRAEHYAMEALAEVDKRSAKKLLPYEHAVQWSEQPELKARLLGYLAASGHVASARQLRLAAQSGDVTARAHAAMALAPIDPEAARSALHRVRPLVTQLLQAHVAGTSLVLGDIRAEQTLLKLLHSDDSQARTACALEFARAGSANIALTPEVRRQVKRRLALALKDTELRARVAAAVALLTLK